IIPSIIKAPSFIFDETGFYSNDKTTIIGSDDRFLLGVLNSKICGFFVSHISSTKQGGYFEYKPMYLVQIPIAEAKSQATSIASSVEQMLDLHKRQAAVKTDHERTLLERQISATDREIDRLVYELYGLTEEEIKIVDGTSQ
ncbi:MAG: TaqI-like C-terminal specificity domain-containing protein, partial [Thermoplasmata archaeon]|nr:TaqI-like C-terminal specificity domain-containing protein [Thermoplasmata archaeon]